MIYFKSNTLGKNIFIKLVNPSGVSGGAYPYNIYKMYTKSKPPWKATHFTSSLRTISLLKIYYIIDFYLDIL